MRFQTVHTYFDPMLVVSMWVRHVRGHNEKGGMIRSLAIWKHAGKHDITTSSAWEIKKSGSISKFSISSLCYPPCICIANMHRFLFIVVRIHPLFMHIAPHIEWAVFSIYASTTLLIPHACLSHPAL